jgi:tetratricopeptide (TPR) repeat protein
MLYQLLGRPDEAARNLEQALDLARSLGHATLECNVLCNLGIVLEGRGQSAQARTHFEDAVELARTLGDERSAGQFLGYLGRLHARQGRHEPARQCLDDGEAALERQADRFGLAVLLCSRAEAELLAGRASAAGTVLHRAAALAAQIGAEATSEVGLAIAQVRELLALPSRDVVSSCCAPTGPPAGSP